MKFKLLDNCNVYLIKNFLDDSEIADYTLCCQQITNWKSGTTSTSKKINRHQLYFQDNGIYFSPDWKCRYDRWLAHPFPDWLKCLQTKCEIYLNNLLNFNIDSPINFNSSLINLYKDGQDGIRAHRDAQPLWGENPIIASVSLGATRTFLLEPIYYDENNPRSAKKHKDLESLVCRLEKGDLLIMSGETQKHYLHSIPKEPQCKESRYNITFRTIIEEYITQHEQ